MSFFNITITLAVGMVMLGGAALTYKHRMLERQMEMEQHPLAGAVAQNKTKGTGLAPLPKWDDKNYKGLNYR